MRERRKGSELSEEFEVKVGMQQGSVLSPFLQLWWILSLNWHESVCYVSCCVLMT